MNSKIKLLIAEDSKLTVLGLKTTFEQTEHIELIDVAENGLEVIEKCKQLKPDVILMDIGMPIIDGIQATKEIKKRDSDVKIIILTSHDSDSQVLEAFSAGANSYCMKETDPKDLIMAIKSTFKGNSWIDSSIARVILSNVSSNENRKKSELTDREVEILKLISKGKSNQELSEALYISMNTVKTHIKNIFSKLEVNDRMKAAIIAKKNNII